MRSGGKEELRANMLRPYLLRAKEEKGAETVAALISECGAKGIALESDGTWMTATQAVKLLDALRNLLGPNALVERGVFTTRGECLGAYVGMLRAAHTPQAGYRYLVEHTLETTRIGQWEIGPAVATAKDTPESLNTTRTLKLLYKLRTDADDLPKLSSREERLLCRCRTGELAALPRLWGLPDAVVTKATCIGKKDATCTYIVELPAADAFPIPPALAAVLAATVVLLLVWLTGTLASAILPAVIAGALLFLLMRQWRQSRVERIERAFEKNRATALERGLDSKQEARELGGDWVGAVLGGKYRIRRRIGAGGIGSVYLAEHMTLGNDVAIKVLRGAAAKDPSEVARLRREAQIQTHIEHPNVARVFDLDNMPDGSIYVVMERLIGRSLADKLQREGLATPGYLLPIFIGVCRGLTAAHERGVVHRDLKPGNIFVCDDGTAKILDFGMSKLTSAEALTQQGYTLGTPEYMAPEQCIGAAVEPRTDLYALGVLMYEMLTGSLPIRAENRRDLLDLHQKEAPKPARTFRPDLPIPQELDEAILMCLEKRITDRPKSARYLEELLARINTEGLPERYPAGQGTKLIDEAPGFDNRSEDGAQDGLETEGVIPSADKS
jgi:eukaryotic-like serine/threonine-protein kinase